MREIKRYVISIYLMDNYLSRNRKPLDYYGGSLSSMGPGNHVLKSHVDKNGQLIGGKNYKIIDKMILRNGTLILIALMVGCKTTKKSQNYYSEDGIILLSDLKIDYFFPFQNSDTYMGVDYDQSQYSQGFLLTGLVPKLRSDLIKNHADEIESQNHPFAYIVPVRVGYSYADTFQDNEVDSLTFTINQVSTTFYFDSKYRHLKQIIPLK